MRLQLSPQTRLSSAQKRLAVVLVLSTVLPCAVALFFFEAVELQSSFDALESLTSSLHRAQVRTTQSLLRYISYRGEDDWRSYIEHRDEMLSLVSVLEDAEDDYATRRVRHSHPGMRLMEGIDSEYARLQSLHKADSSVAIAKTVRESRELQKVGDAVRAAVASRDEPQLNKLRNQARNHLDAFDSSDEQITDMLTRASSGLQHSLKIRTRVLVAGVSTLLLLVGFVAMHGIKVAERRAYSHLAALEALAASSPDAILLRDAESRYLFMNDVAASRIGMTPDEATGLTSTQVLGPRNGTVISNVDREVVSTGAPCKVDLVMSIGDQERILETLNSPVFGSDGSIVAVACVARDVTDQRKQENHLRMLACALENAGDAIFISDATFDPQPTVVYANKAFLNLVGLPESEVIGCQPASCFMGEDSADRIRTSLITTGEFHGEVMSHLRSGKRVYLDLHIVPVYDDGKLTNFVSVQRDITRKMMEQHNQRRLLQMLMNAQREERRRISIQLHDHAGQMLTTMLLRLATLQNTAHEETVKTAIAEITGVAASTLEDISRLARGLYPAILDDLGLVEAIRRTLQEFEAAGIRAEIIAPSFEQARLPAQLEGELYQILQQALSNVRKHSRADNVTVSLERRNGTVTAIVADDGVGFNTEVLEKPSNGSRLGIIGIKERASLLGGNMSIRSSNSGGTQMEVNLPLLEPSRVIEVVSDNG